MNMQVEATLKFNVVPNLIFSQHELTAWVLKTLTVFKYLVTEKMNYTEQSLK